MIEVVIGSQGASPSEPTQLPQSTMKRHNKPEVSSSINSAPRASRHIRVPGRDQCFRCPRPGCSFEFDPRHSKKLNVIDPIPDSNLFLDELPGYFEGFG
jgi:hypothetical protein